MRILRKGEKVWKIGPCCNMARGKKKDFLKQLNPFSFGLPNAGMFFLMLLVISIVMGIGSTALLNHNAINTSLNYIAANGSLAGIIVIMLPAMLTVVVVKLFKRYIDLKYIAFVALVGALSYSVFILLSAITSIVFGSYVAGLILLVGDASLFGWWFFTIKLLMGRKKRNLILALIHPTLNILLYIPYSSRIVSFSTPFNLLLIKLYAGIFIFMIVSYVIIFVVDRPYKKNFGFDSFDAFTQLVQNWLFSINTSAPFGSNFGSYANILTDTIAVKGQGGKIKAVFFAPNIHYGPAGTIGGSDFPYMLERHVQYRYKAPAFIMHRTVDMDYNPVASSQFHQMRDALDNGVKHATQSKGTFTYTESMSGDSLVSRLGFGDISLVTLTRAPKITEDVSNGMALLFNEMLESRFGTSIVIDAHNSRFETAPKQELDGVKEGSKAAEEYTSAIRAMKNPEHKTGSIRAGFSSMELYHRLGDPVDIGRGNMNVAVFRFNGFKRAMIHLNANNMVPQLRDRIVRHLKHKYGISADVYTTDTHSVNSLGFEADNVVGRKTKFVRLCAIIDKNVELAIKDMEVVKVYHNRNYVKKFKIWGQNSMATILAMANSVYGITRILIPLIVVAGFVVAAFVISVV